MSQKKLIRLWMGAITMCVNISEQQVDTTARLLI